MPDTLLLSPSPDYFPLANGRYEVTAGLRALGAKAPHELDLHYLAYMRAKAEARRENPGKYYLRETLSPELERAMARWALTVLPQHHPHAFEAVLNGDSARFRNRLLGLDATLDLAALKVTALQRETALLAGSEAVYAEFDFVGCDLFDFLALQTQEDWALVALEPETKREWLAAVHLSFPNHWSPAEKIGRPFVDVHRPVAGIEPLLKAAPSLMEVTVHKGPWERFAWGVATDRTLNHHPDNAEDPAHRAKTLEAAEAGTFDPTDVCLRIERQVLWGYPAAGGALFLIRTYFLSLADVMAVPERKQALASAIKGMSPEAVRYKGLTQLGGPLVAYLET